MKKLDFTTDEPVQSSDVEVETKISFVPAETFVAYPEGAKTEFLVGRESAPLPASFVEIMRAKGLVAD